MISLESIRIFLRSAETGSFSAAGRSLRLSPSVVSYRIQTLEEHLGCLLLTRTTRRMSLTEAGRIFYDRCLDITAAVEQAEKSVETAGAVPRGVLKVTAPLGLGRRVVAPLVPRFRDRHGETDVRLRLSEHLLDLVQEAVDVAIRLSQMRDSTFTLRKVAEIERVLCAAPAYLAEHPAPAEPADLLQHDCLLLRYPGAEQFRWTLVDGQETVTLPVSGHIDADDGDTLTAWTLAGEGIVLKPLFEVAAHLAEGRLVPVLEHTPPTSVTLGLLYPSRKMLSARTKTFVDMTHEALRQHVSEQLALVGGRAV
ncbi:transcriptional regulator, LysR family [Methylobacterium sp. 275MFSha3.1]|uniref:LysR family transcriptional regulator n=1 Tax=Methylobacterium sp. 275MFSha3.1 TaxID=1502746 RepID=UPI0008A7A464|nr:LysR family transcriptional regulator [Methylobacterium sp. 275MFSha3.1]SEH96546.1 transcriptional regulator, LysR family [Methylobacterium sp. 275MFSha3.1]